MEGPRIWLSLLLPVCVWLGQVQGDSVVCSCLDSKPLDILVPPECRHSCDTNIALSNDICRCCPCVTRVNMLQFSFRNCDMVAKSINVTDIVDKIERTLNNMTEMSVACDSGTLQMYQFQPILFQTRRLTSVNLSSCNLDNVPKKIFATLEKMESLDLSNNRLRLLHLDLTGSGQIGRLYLNNNSMSAISSEMFDQMNRRGKNLTIRISGNVFYCSNLVMNGVTFVSWMETTSVVVEDKDMVKCVQNDGTIIPWKDANSCERGTTKLIIAFAVTGGVLIIIIIILLCIIVSILVKRETRPNPVNQRAVSHTRPIVRRQESVVVARPFEMQEYPIPAAPSPPIRQNSLQLLKLAFEDSEHQFTQDIFLFYREDCEHWIQDYLIPLIENRLQMSQRSQENFEPGGVVLDEMMRNIHESRFILLVLTKLFVSCPECRFVAQSSYAFRPHAVVPISYNITENHLRDNFFWSIVESNGLIQWSDDKDEQKEFANILETRLKDKLESDIFMDLRDDDDSWKLTENAMIDIASLTPRPDQIFIYFSDKDTSFIRQTLAPYLTNQLSFIVQEDDYFPGTVFVEEVLKSVQSSQFTILVVSESFVNDRKCREVTARACALRPEAVVSIKYNLEHLRLDNTLFQLVTSSIRSVLWTGDEYRSDFFASLKEKLVT